MTAGQAKGVNTTLAISQRQNEKPIGGTRVQTLRATTTPLAHISMTATSVA